MAGDKVYSKTIENEKISPDQIAANIAIKNLDIFFKNEK